MDESFDILWHQFLSNSLVNLVRHDPKFIKLFYEAAINVIPVIFILVLTPIELRIQSASQVFVITKNSIHSAKVILFGAQISVLIFMISHEVPFTSYESVCIAVVAIALLLTHIHALILVRKGRRNGLQTSIILFIFWAIQTICSVITFQLQEVSVLACWRQRLKFSFAVINFLQLLVACCPEPAYNRSNTIESNACPEQSRSIPSRISLSWLTELLYRGYRRPLTLKDLWSLPLNLQCEAATKTFESHWKYVPNSPRSHVIFSLLKTYPLELLTGCTLKLCSSLMAIATPVVLRYFMKYIVSENGIAEGVFYSVLLFALVEMSSIFGLHHLYQMNVARLGFESSLICAVYKKAQKMSPETQKKYSIGEMVNLISKDVHQFKLVMPLINHLWCTPLEIVIIVTLLWQFVGQAVLTGVALLVVMIPINGFIEKATHRIERKVLAQKDERIKLITEIIDGIRILKLYAWEIPYSKKVARVRNEEMKGLKKIAYLNASTMLTWYSCTFLISIGTFVTFSFMDDKNFLSPEIAFVALTLFSLLRRPVIVFPQTIARTMKLKASLDRINRFLVSEELDFELFKHKSIHGESISIKNASFSWEKACGSPVLKDLSITAAPNSLIAVIGKVGSGKSSLISALCGELYKLKGQANIQGKIAYVPSTSWIINATLRQNITMFQPENRLKYEKILAACRLQPDLDILPGGDATEIGEKGINLSGGQKQRISLARAVYHDADIYLIDDPLSSVDSHTAKGIFGDVIGPNGLLSGTTRIMVTHNLSFLPHCDKILLVNNGQVYEVESYKALISKNSLVSEFLSQYFSEMDKNRSQSEVVRTEDVSHFGGRHLKCKKEKAGTSTENSMKVLKLSENSPETKKFQLISQEEVKTGGVLWAVYKSYLKTVGFSAFFFLTAAWVLAESSFVGSRIWLKDWSSGLQTSNSSKINELQHHKILIYSLFGLMEAIFVFIASNGFAYVTCKASGILHENMLMSLMESPISFFDATPVGRILNRFTEDMDVADTELLWGFTDVIKISTKAALAVAVISTEFTQYLPIIIMITLLYFYIQKLYVASSLQISRLRLTTSSHVLEHYSESLIGLSSMRAYKFQDKFIKELNMRVDTTQACSFVQMASVRWVTFYTEALGNASFFVAVMLFVIYKDHVDAAAVGLCVSSALILKDEIRWLIRVVSYLENQMVSTERILDYSTLPSESKVSKNSSSKWLTEGKIEFCSYSACYRKNLDLSLRSITCCINPGEKIGICGRTGAGKTSLCLALFRIFEAGEGKILIDGIDIAHLKLHHLRSSLTIIPQIPTIFSGTLRENIDPFEEYDDLDIWRALKHSHLKSFVFSLDNCLDFYVYKNGSNLSAGQCQLICLTRALLQKSKIIILDEATAMVDIETDRIVQDMIRKEFKDCTVLTIAHRISTIMDSSRIMVLEQGEVAEFDSPINLSKNKNSLFCKLIENLAASPEKAN